MGTEDITLYAIWERSQSCNAAHPELHIPTGFAHLTGTVSDGYVITDGTISNGTSDGNEFVWIPVDGKTTGGDFNIDYKKKLGTNNWRLINATDTAEGNRDTTDTTDGLTSNVRGDKLGFSTDATSTILGVSGINNTEDNSRPEKQLIENAGGFWVGRYEAGTTATTAETETTWEEANAKNRVVSKAGVQPARQIYQSQALSIANAWDSRTGVVNTTNTTNGTVAWKSGLITGAQWDSMCKFIYWTTCDEDCTNWGNYNNIASKTYTETIWHSTDRANDWTSGSNIAKGTSNNRWVFPTGKFVNSNEDTTEKKHIFDVAGNVWEWSTEISINGSGSNAVLRGGSANDNSTYHFATYRNGGNSASTDAGWSMGFRLVLYVQ